MTLCCFSFPPCSTSELLQGAASVGSWWLTVALLRVSASEHESASKQNNIRENKKSPGVTGSRSCGSDCVCHRDVVSVKTKKFPR